MSSSRFPDAGGRTPLQPVAVAGHADDAYKAYVACSLLLAVLLGFALAIHVPANRLLQSGVPDHESDLIHSHGQVQLLGFAGLYVMGMSYRLIPRFTSSHISLGVMIPLTLWLTVLGLLTKSLLMPWLEGDLHDAALLGSALCLLSASACFLLNTAATVVGGRRGDPSAYPFVAGALLLFVAMEVDFVASIAAVRDGLPGPSYLARSAVLQLELAGFLVSFVLGVASRALPAMSGHERPERATRLTALALAVAVLSLAGGLLCREYVTTGDWTVRLIDVSVAAAGVVFLQIASIAGVLRPAANRVRPASQPNMWLVRSAFFWLAIAGLLAVYLGVSSLISDEIVTQLQFDALRHLLAVGVVTMLIVGMSLMILPEFAGQRLSANLQRWLALLLAALLNGAVVLRVAPSLAGGRWSIDLRDALMAAAGGLAETAMLLFAFSLLRLLLQNARTAGDRLV